MALLADFGVSSLQFDQARRGFSFQADGPLDMRMDTRTGPTAGQVVNEMNERELANLIYEYGEERRSRTVARAIVRGRPVTYHGAVGPDRSLSRPANEIRSDSPGYSNFSGAAYLMSIRNWTKSGHLFEAAPKLLKPSARLVVISFHSLEDRIAKDSFREGARQGIWNILTKKPVTAGEDEIDRNPRSRSAKLQSSRNDSKD